MKALKRRIRLSFKLFLLTTCSLILITTISGCGYSTRSLIAQLYRTIYVRPFANKIDITSETSVARNYKIYRPLLEKDITREVIDEFVLDGGLRLAKEEDAELILEGELIDYRKDALRYTDDDDVDEYRISLVVNIKLWDTRKDTLFWEATGFVGDTTYFTQGSLAKSESSAIAAAVEDLARRIVDRVVEIW